MRREITLTLSTATHAELACFSIDNTASPECHRANGYLSYFVLSRRTALVHKAVTLDSQLFRIDVGLLHLAVLLSLIPWLLSVLPTATRASREPTPFPAQPVPAMSACVVSSVPELDSHLSFIDLCCIFAEETNDKLADLWQQPGNPTEAAPRAQLSHLDTALRALLSTMHQLHSTVAGWKAEEDDDDDDDDDGEADAEQRAEAQAEAEAVTGEAADGQADKENEQPVAQQLLARPKPHMESPAASSDTDSRPQPPYSILASPAQFDAIAQPLAPHTAAFATPAANSRRRRASCCSDGRSQATVQQRHNQPLTSQSLPACLH